MINNFIPLDFDIRLHVGLFRALMLSVISISMISTSVSSQSDPGGSPEKSSDDLQELYDCASYYSVVEYCYSRDSSKASQHTSVVAFRSRDKIIHLIYIDSKRAGVLPETSQNSMLASSNKMLRSMGYQCPNLVRLNPKFSLSCDMLIKNVPDHIYDKGQKAGRQEERVPILIG